MTGFLIPTTFPVTMASASRSAGGSQFSLTVMVPCRDESIRTISSAVESIVSRSGDREEIEVWIVYERDRPVDAEVVAAVTRNPTSRAGRVKSVPVESSVPKARAINEAVAMCRTDLCAIFDADTRPNPNLLRTMIDVLVGGGADFVEAFDLSTGRSWRDLAGNAQAIAFQGSMNWLSRRHGRRFMGTSSVAFRRTLFDDLGPLPVDGVEEGYRWSLGRKRAVVRHQLVVGLVPGDVPITIGNMLNQRTRWKAGQWDAALAAIAHGSVDQDRRLALVGIASLCLQGAATAGLLMLPLLPRACKLALGVALGAEYARLRSRGGRRIARSLGVSSSPLAALVLEILEGLMIWRGLFRVARGRASYWDRVRS